ncbi:MAG: efflux RND transporter permease subunit [Acidaminococcaceae bacterium]|nr:efflux RND transporter permease subunit [Acidaminococcaceae bacterium]MCI2109878.1 efflux RND transporter permease subunit [Acidaminococcaceae bacterium]
MAKFFIDHPVFACVLSVIIALLGIISAYTLPVAQYPQISNPRVRVSTNYVGANAEVLEQSVAQAIEKKVNGVDKMIDMRSTSDNNGNYSLEVMFDLSADPDMSTVKVQNRVAQANSSLPSEVTAYGITTTKQSAETIMYFALTSPNHTYDSLFLKNYGATHFVDALKRVDGVSEVNEFGPELSMRVWLNPQKMAQLGITATDVSSAIKSQSVQAPVGSIGARPTEKEQEFQYSARVQGRLETPEEFGNIILTNVNGAVLKLKDVARIELGPRDDTIVGKLDGQSSVIYPIYLNTDANALTSVSKVKQVLAEAEKDFPPDMKLTIVQDNTDYVKESLKEVGYTFLETLVLVVLITWLFLQSWRATLVPTLAIPVSLLGTFSSFLIFGFTINTLTLFALVLAIGIVVDDAIVVVEAVEHNIEAYGMSPKEATYRAMQSVSGPIVATAFVLLAVFLPIATLGGTTGVLYKQFALTITVALTLSAVVALSLSPAVCSLVLKPKTARDNKGAINKLFNFFDSMIVKSTGKYAEIVKKLLRYFRLSMCSLLVIVVLIIGFYKIIPSGFVPDEDQSFALVAFNLPESAASNRTLQVLDELQKKVEKIPGVKHVIEVTGIDILSNARKPNAGMVSVKADELSERTTAALGIKSIINQANALGPQTPAANVMAFNAATLPGMSNTGSLSLYIMDMTGVSSSQMSTDVKKLLGALNKRPEVANAYSTFNSDTPSYQFEVDREKAESLNVPISSVFTTLQAYLGGSEVNDFNRFGQTWKVVMQAEAPYRTDTTALSSLFVRSNDGAMVPLNTLVKSKAISAPAAITRFNGVSGAKISGAPAPGYSSGQAMTAVEEVMAENLPEGYTYQWTDQSRDEKASGSSFAKVFSISLIFVFLVLAALYESWSLPLSIILAIPAAVLGTVSLQYFRGLQSDVYMQIGMIVLIGLSAKTSILIVEYAKMNVDNGKAVLPAIMDAVRARFRSILMTAFSTIIGSVPLAIATGAGAGSRTSIGTAIIGGMILGILYSLFFVPVLFLVVQKIFHRDHKMGNVDEVIDDNPENKPAGDVK